MQIGEKTEAVLSWSVHADSWRQKKKYRSAFSFSSSALRALPTFSILLPPSSFLKALHITHISEPRRISHHG